MRSCMKQFITGTRTFVNSAKQRKVVEVFKQKYDLRVDGQGRLGAVATLEPTTSAVARSILRLQVQR
jgi:hypothetical protein